MPEAVSVEGTVVIVVLLVVKLVLLVTATTVGLGGFVARPDPVRPMPAASPVVLVVLIVGTVPRVQLVSVTPAAVSERLLPLPAA